VDRPDQKQSRRPEVGVAFLLAQLGAHASAAYAERTARLDLTPAATGVLRLLVENPGVSQQDLATRLGIAPSTLVPLMDRLQGRGLVERRRSDADRRNYELRLTDAGWALFADLRAEAAAHEQAITAGLEPEERAALRALLSKLVAARGLTPGVHPGYRQPERRQG
jgi:DNA-binding MarR family transcriptional regulator